MNADEIERYMFGDVSAIERQVVQQLQQPQTAQESMYINRDRAMMEHVLRVQGHLTPHTVQKHVTKRDLESMLFQSSDTE